MLIISWKVIQFSKYAESFWHTALKFAYKILLTFYLFVLFCLPCTLLSKNWLYLYLSISWMSNYRLNRLINSFIFEIVQYKIIGENDVIAIIVCNNPVICIFNRFLLFIFIHVILFIFDIFSFLQIELTMSNLAKIYWWFLAQSWHSWKRDKIMW